jgi:hypothetical protein
MAGDEAAWGSALEFGFAVAGKYPWPGGTWEQIDTSLGLRGPLLPLSPLASSNDRAAAVQGRERCGGQKGSSVRVGRAVVHRRRRPDLH